MTDFKDIRALPIETQIGMAAQLADAGMVAQRESADAIEEASANGGAIRRPDGTLKRGALTSAAEDGWAWCVHHGHTHSVDSDGKWARSGTCEACFKQDFSPERLERRKRETAVRLQQEADAAALAARIAADAAAEAAAALKPNP